MVENLYNPLINPYETTYGKLIPKEKLETSLQNLIIRFGQLDKRDLSYGIYFNQLIPVIILGKDQDEMDIPLFPFPYIFKGREDRVFIAIDLREYVNPGMLKEKGHAIQNPNDFNLVINRLDNAHMLLLMAGLMDKLASNGFKWLNKEPLLRLYSYFYHKIISSIMALNPTENADVQYHTILYYYTLLEEVRPDTLPLEKLTLYMERFTKPLGIPNKDQALLIASFIQSQLNITDENYKTLKTLLEVSFSTVSEDRKISPVHFTNNIQNLWMGPGKQHTSFICFENFPLFMSMIFMGKKSSFKETRFSKLLKGTYIKYDDFLKSITLDFKFLK